MGCGGLAYCSNIGSMTGDDGRSMQTDERHRLKRAIPLIAVGAVLIVLGVLGRQLGNWLAAPDPVKKVDLLVVSEGDPERRVPLALDYLARGQADEVWVLTQRAGPVLNEPRAVRSFAADAGVDSDRLRTIAGSNDLVRDAVRSAEALRDRDDISRVAVLTATRQQARTRLVYERSLSRDVLVWSDKSRFDARRWWRSRAYDTLAEGMKYVVALASLGPGPEQLPERVTAGVPARAFAGGAVVALLVGALCRLVAPRMGFVSVPRLWRTHSRPTSMLGGLAIVLGLGGGMIAGGNLRIGVLGAVAGAGVIGISLVGLVDDVAGLGAPARLVWASAAGAAAWLLGLRIVAVTGGEPVGDLINAGLTLLWFVGVTLSLNLLDNMDGVTAGVGAAASITIAVAAALGGQFVVTAAASALAGACIGYLVHNVHPARLFMGDMGALGLGFALAALALQLRPHPTPPLSMAVPVMALGIPIFDVVLVTVSRLREGRSPSLGGTDHAAHRLVARGMSARVAAAFLWVGQLILGAFAVLVARASVVVGVALVCLVGVSGLVALFVFLRMPVWNPPAHLERTDEDVLADGPPSLGAN